MKERQPSHKQNVISIALMTILGCLSILIPAYAQVNNPSTGDTIQAYCSDGVCHTPGGVVNAVRPNVTATAPLASPIGSVTLSQPCIGSNCLSHTTISQVGTIGLQLSQVCLADLIHHQNTTCLNYNDLKQFDNTNPLYSGLWVETPYEHRLAPKIRNHEVFNVNPWVVMVDPNADYTVKSKMIIIDNHFNYTNQNDTNTNGGLSMKTYVDRYVSPNCVDARVGPNLDLINDTIYYLESNCTITHYNTTKIISQPEIAFSYDNQYSTLHLDSYLKQILHGHSSANTNQTGGGLGPSDCIRHTCSFTDPYKKVGY